MAAFAQALHNLTPTITVNMPKKFVNENPKVIAARERKAAAKKEEENRKQKALEDAYWADDDKLVNRKLQRKEEEERKRAEALKRKEEIRKLAEAEMNSLVSNSAGAQSQKVTRATIEQRRETEQRLRLEEEKRLKLAAQKIEVVDHLEENLNQLELDKESARTVSDAIRILGGDREEVDIHPERRMRAAYLAFEETRLPRLKQEHPTYRLSQLKQLVKKEWQKSPENPFNAKLMALAAK